MNVLDLSTHLPGTLAASVLQQNGHRVSRLLPSENASYAFEPLVLKTYSADEELRYDPRSLSDQQRVRSYLAQSDGLILALSKRMQVLLNLDCVEILQTYPSIRVLRFFASESHNRPQHDLNLQGAEGLLGFPPRVPTVPIVQWIGGYEGAMRLVSAPQNTRDIRISLDSLVKRLIQPWRETPSFSTSFLSGQFPCYHVYQCKDSTWMSVAAVEPHFWKIWCTHIERPDLVPFAFDPDYVNEVAKAVGLFTSKELRTKLLAAPCCVEPVTPLFGDG